MLFEVRDICKSYNKVPIFSGFSLKVEKGDMIALVGKRRQGKTTLMQMLAGIIPVDSGEIYYEDKLVARKGRTAGLCRLRRNKIGYLTTEAILLPDLTVYENLLLAMNHKRGSTKAKKAKAKEVLKNLGLKGKGRFFPKELSTLEKQKVCVARAIINEPELLLCDEPTDILEGYGAEQMMDILEILNSAGYTIVLSTHSKRIAGRCRKVYPIHEGLDLTGLIREGGLVQETGEFEAVSEEGGNAGTAAAVGLEETEEGADAAGETWNENGEGADAAGKAWNENGEGANAAGEAWNENGEGANAAGEVSGESAEAAGEVSGKPGEDAEESAEIPEMVKAVSEAFADEAAASQDSGSTYAEELPEIDLSDIFR